MTPPLITRGRLLEYLNERPRAVVEAGAGYGKSVLATQYGESLGIATVHLTLDRFDRDPAVLLAGLRRALVRARLSDLAAAVEGSEPPAAIERLIDALDDRADGILIVFDDAHHLEGGEGVELLGRIMRTLPEHHRLLVAARSFSGSLEAIWRQPGAVQLDTATLAFTTEETGRLLDAWALPGGEHAARMLVEATHGWATAVAVSAAARARDNGGTLPGFGDPLAAPLAAILSGMAAPVRAAAVTLAHLPFLSPDVAAAIDDDITFDQILQSGIPLVRTALGWWEMPSPVAQSLAARAPLDDAAARRVAAVYEDHGDVLAGLRILIASGAVDDAARTLAALAPHRVEAFGSAVVQALLAGLTDEAIAAHPGVLLHAARLAEIDHRGGLRAGLLAEAGRHITPLADPVLERELAAERARDLMWDERTRDEADTLARAVLDGAGPSEAVARARALDVLGRLGSWFSADGPKPEAERLLQESARLARSIGQRTWAAQALAALGAGFYFALCRFERSLAVLDEALGDLPARNRYRATVQTFRADTLTEQGRFGEAEAAIDEIRQIAEVFDEDWIHAYVGWNSALLASYRSDAPATIEAVGYARRHEGGWFTATSGVEFLAQAADYLDRVGEHALADRLLAEAEERREGATHLVRVHGAAIAARSGEPGRGRAEIEAVLAQLNLEEQERWPLLLLRAHAARRNGDPDAGVLAAVAFDECAELGHPEGPLIRERDLAQPLLALAREAGSSAAGALLGDGAGRSWAIRMLGGFDVECSGHAVTLPPGRPLSAVQMLAVSGGRLHAEVLSEQLWPGADAAAARNRLRNLLSRIRRAADGLVERDGESIRLSPATIVDADRFAVQADAALTSGEGDRRAAGLAQAAVELYRGELLPDEPYAEWTFAARERLAARHLALIGLLAAIAERDGETDQALRLVQRALDLDPDDEERLLTLARLLASQGRTTAAARTLRRALDDSQEWPASARNALERAYADYTADPSADTR